MLTCLLPNRSWQQHQSQSPAAFLLPVTRAAVHVHVQDETLMTTRHHYHYHYHHQVKGKTMRRPCSQPTTWARRALVSVRRRERADTGFALLIFVGKGKGKRQKVFEKEMASGRGGKTTIVFRISEFSIAGARNRVRVRKAGPSIEVVATLVAACSLRRPHCLFFFLFVSRLIF